MADSAERTERIDLCIEFLVTGCVHRRWNQAEFLTEDPDDVRCLTFNPEPNNPYEASGLAMAVYANGQHAGYVSKDDIEDFAKFHKLYRIIQPYTDANGKYVKVLETGTENEQVWWFRVEIDVTVMVPLDVAKQVDAAAA